MVYEVKIFRRGSRKHRAVNETCAVRAAGAGLGAGFGLDPATTSLFLPLLPATEVGGGLISRAVAETGLPPTDGAVAFFFRC